jgi:predicted transcriptional regulator of viral defense system
VTLREQVEVEFRQWLSSHYGVIGYAEAMRLGATTKIIESKLDRGVWVRMYRSVYRDAAASTTAHQKLRAAYVVTAGHGVASHLSAAWLWELLDQPPAVPEVTVQRSKRDIRGQRGLTVHRSRDLDLATASEWKHILVTNPLRTLVDLAAVATPARLTEAVDNALAHRLVTTAGLEAEIGRLSRQGRPGITALQGHLSGQGFVGAPQPSVLEARARRLVLGTGLPDPTVEQRAGEDGEYRLDIAWVAILFAVEVDGYAWHFNPAHKERDETRRNRLKQAGWTVLVYSWRQVVNEPGRLAREITETYRRLSPPG